MAAYFTCCTKPVGRGGRWRGVSASVGESAPGDLGAPTFHDLFREYFGQMTRLAHLLGADDAENVAQEAFVKLHQRWDSPNSAGIIIDAVRAAKIALDRGIGGPILSASSYFMKSPPEQYDDSTARDAVEKFIRGEVER